MATVTVDVSQELSLSQLGEGFGSGTLISQLDFQQTAEVNRISNISVLSQLVIIDSGLVPRLVHVNQQLGLSDNVVQHVIDVNQSLSLDDSVYIERRIAPSSTLTFTSGIGLNINQNLSVTSMIDFQQVAIGYSEYTC